MNRRLPTELDWLILDCLRKQPDDRPSDAGAVLDRIGSSALAGAWSNLHARAWWEAKLPELAGPLDSQ